MGGVKAFTLDRLTKAVDEATKVIKLADLEPNYAIAVVTQDEMEYDITVLEPQTGLVRVKGGLFIEPTECKLCGSTPFGGSMLVTNRVMIGMCMEFWKNGNIITTDPVKIIGWRIPPTTANSKTVH